MRVKSGARGVGAEHASEAGNLGSSAGGSNDAHALQRVEQVLPFRKEARGLRGQ